VLGLGIPVASSRLDPLDEETTQYVPEAMPGVSLSALLARCAHPSEPGDELTAPTVPNQPNVTSTTGIRPRDASFHTVPHFPDESRPEIQVAESNLHEVVADRITDALVVAPQRPDAHLRIGVSSRPPALVSPSPPRPQSTRRRSLFAKFLFVTIAVAVALLAATELSKAGNMHWLDPRPLLAKGVKFAKEKIPWDRLPTIHRR
jgi:hypothetical protein